MPTFEFHEETKRKTRKGVRIQATIHHENGRSVTQWMERPYEEGEEYEPPNPPVQRKLPRSPTPIEDLPADPEKIRALSVRQPYAEMIITGEKEIEYRSRNTNIRGRVYIYASAKKYNNNDRLDFADQTGISADQIKDLPRKVIVGSVEIYDSREADTGGYEWFLRNPIRFDTPRAPNPDERANPVWFNPFGT